MPNSALAWMAIARSLLGVREVPGPGNSTVIAGWLSGLKAWWAEDATPWCGVFVAHVMHEAGQPIAKQWYRAKSWLKWGVGCPPAYGAVCVLGRQGGGHVFFVTKVSKSFVWGIGGNQGDAVSEARFARARVLGFRWPKALPLPLPLQIVADGGGEISRNEQ
ncbi:TIGR02594 family protein [Rhizorhabdus sp.]|uniref:TIGR02594 family protein n=1 Tax=Rhizorhabdus sp. TaxID=1968843 RepID=UPI0019BCBE12|nr:TIGR02594 family protein [Rhizorhabdus sp.]MBD3762575.1 TIGR02594 family protein [Rhizorhabdus sp.]